MQSVKHYLPVLITSAVNSVARDVGNVVDLVYADPLNLLVLVLGSPKVRALDPSFIVSVPVLAT